MRPTIVPEPSEPEREAILAALAPPERAPDGTWAEVALTEAVEDGELEP